MLPQRYATVLLVLLVCFAGMVVFYLPPQEQHEVNPTPQATHPSSPKSQPPVKTQPSSPKSEPPVKLQPPAKGRTKEEIEEWLKLQQKFEEEQLQRNQSVVPPMEPTRDEEYLKAQAYVKSLNQTQLELLVKKLTYWEVNPLKHKEPLLINHDRFLTWMPYSAGLNNRRISMEIAYVFALITNRTLVLPPISGWQNPFPVPFLMEQLHQLDDLKAGVPIMTWTEWLQYPQRQAVWEDTVLCPWDLKYGIPHEESPLYHRLAEFVSQHRELVHVRDPYTVQRFNTAKNLYFPENMLFNHFYTQFYFTPESPFQVKDVTKIIRDHVHFPKGCLEFVARILYFLPEFSAMHYRRGDFAYDTGKLAPATIFNETLEFYEDEETIYVSTDEDPVAFQQQFVPVFERRYKIVTLGNFKHLLFDMHPMYEPMVEMLICSSARVFVGTMLSTYSGYIQRLRGYHKWIQDKGPHFTQRYNGGVPQWGQERSDAWDQIEDAEVVQGTGKHR